jgi:DNA-binding transcriptional MerR regulator
MKANRSDGDKNRLFTIAGAAHALAISKGTLLNLEKRGVIRPKRAVDSPTRSQRIYDDADLRSIMHHYQTRGRGR